MELNVSGTGDWNLYRFDGQRSGMREQTMDEAPASRLDVEPTLVRMVCSLRLDHVRLPSAITAGPAVVLEHEDGSRSCWALSHPEARPDFHLREHHALFDYGREGLDAGPAGRYMSIKR